MVPVEPIVWHKAFNMICQRGARVAMPHRDHRPEHRSGPSYNRMMSKDQKG